ncbi:tetratricopeptide repeat protein [Gracilibacillus salinarum]|uniref:Tetratricopeptide repeat protein n=1 Tax=Gracilibacillus salinarum TaxID=2932255 RepID=A0ABY4GNI2_9BACI|nr:tetratricopeptide repeat protein [Gracilibacillus salinarum]UOQ85761.1 tetratricopeptide repeat protein [Gracilibacillus salinarum]
MEKQITKAIELRKNGSLKESNELLLTLVKESPNDAYINYQCAWSFDVLGEEKQAAPFYENAISLGLDGKDLEDALLGLGSTYRTLGEYEKSKSTFSKGTELFPDNKAIQVFYAMTLYNLNEHNSAMELLLKCIIDTTTDKEIMRYKKAISFYSDKLDNILV